MYSDGRVIGCARTELASVVGDKALRDREWRKQCEMVGGEGADEDHDCARRTTVVGRSQRSMTPEDKAECGRDEFKEMPGNSSCLKVG